MFQTSENSTRLNSPGNEQLRSIDLLVQKAGQRGKYKVTVSDLIFGSNLKKCGHDVSSLTLRVAIYTEPIKHPLIADILGNFQSQYRV